ncbi:hypothetical protein [Bacteroides gallinarum]|uniref:hypothetical protein n=1 Tax=Bacteroides gallinarum TaxID=376806 RepID=UPI00037544E8|nr:hypothetical protein [Bacteroides gallinarum]
MSIQLHPDIEKLDKDSLCYSIYSNLYLTFFNAQEKKSGDNPYGIEEGDDTSIRLKNTAYGFASAIAGAVGGDEGTEGGILLDYLKLSGGNMAGMLRANYGFEAGTGNTRVLETFSENMTDEEGVVTAVRYGIRVTGDLEVGGRNFYLGGKRVLAYDSLSDTVSWNASVLNFEDTSLRSSGELLFGSEREKGILISPSHLLVHGHEAYHAGNANLSTVGWRMKDADVSGTLAVQGETSLHGRLSALYGVLLGDKGECLLSLSGDEVILSGFLSFGEGYGIKIGGKPVLLRADDKQVQLGSIGDDLLLGSDATPKIRLLSGIADVDGEYLLLSPYGHAVFPGSLSVRHDYGETLLSSYRVDASDEGVIIHKRLRMGSADGFLLTGDRQSVSFSGKVQYDKDGTQTILNYSLRLGFRTSTSHYAPQNRYSDTFRMDTDADFIAFGVPLEASGHVGIDGSATRLADGVLYLNEDLRLQAVTDGIKHYGNSVFCGSLSSENFSSGLAGTGWGILQNRTTGSISATFDELTVRRRMRVYELEVQKQSVTNGSLWVSDSCSGDTVEKL